MLQSASDDLAQVWSTLQELAGIVTPFTDTVRSQAEEDVRGAHEAALADLRAEYEGRLETHEGEQVGTQADRLRRRLMQLAGYRDG
jgi:hypothetical protein